MRFFMDEFKPHIIMTHLSRDHKLLTLFKQMSFLIHRNTYGGITKYDLQALFSIKNKLKQHLDAPSKEHITSIIDSLSLYDAPEFMNAEMVKVLRDNDIFKYIANQSSDDLCDILIEHTAPKNALLLSIPINKEALQLVSELADFSLNHEPESITTLPILPCNIWQMIKEVDNLALNHIHIAFLRQEDQEASFHCYKGLCMAKSYLEQIEEKPEIKKSKPKKKKKPFAPQFKHGIVSLSHKILGHKLDSNVMLSRDVKPKQISKPIENKPSTAPMIQKLDNYNVTNRVGHGFYDIEQGFLFSVT